MKEHKYLKEEFHREEWKPIMIKGKNKQAFVMITEEQAGWMNRNSVEKCIRYVLADKVGDKVATDTNKTLEELRKEYEELAEKKVFHGWNEAQLVEKIAELKK